MAYNGLFKIKNPKKYKGNHKNIVWRSQWELSYMMKLDHDPNVLEWASEEIKIPYTDKATGRLHMYYPDFWVKKKLPNGNVKTFLIEIKPMAQVKKPQRGKKSEKVFLNEVLRYGKNIGKWESAKRFCDKKGWEFIILTEVDLKTF
jgi:hypothetical protein